MTWRPTEPQPIGLIKPIYSWEHLGVDSQPDGLKAYLYLSQHKPTLEDCYRLRITRPVEGGDAIIDDSHLPWGILQGFARLPHPDMIEAYLEGQQFFAESVWMLRQTKDLNQSQFVQLLKERENWREEQRQEQELIANLIGAAIKSCDRLPDDDPLKQSVKSAVHDLQQFWRKNWGSDRVIVVDVSEHPEVMERLSLSLKNVLDENCDESTN